MLHQGGHASCCRARRPSRSLLDLAVMRLVVPLSPHLADSRLLPVRTGSASRLVTHDEVYVGVYVDARERRSEADDVGSGRPDPCSARSDLALA